MQDNGGFVDLRVGYGPRGSGDDSVWPSFTDIMTVIVMIFLMALVVMMTRNFELDRQLVTSVSAREASLLENRALVEKLTALELKLRGLEQSLQASVSERGDLQAQLLEELRRIELLAADKVTLAEQARLAGESLAAAQAENLSLTERAEVLRARTVTLDKERNLARARVADLTASESRLSLELAALSEQFSALKLQSGSEIEALNSANLSLSEQLDTVASELRQIRALLETEQQQRRQLDDQVEEQNRGLLAKQALLERLQLAQQQSAQRYADANAEIDNLNELIRRRQTENAALQKLADASGVKFRSLQEEYESLDAKYRNLARPARSPAGKYVVDVRIDKSGDEYRYQLKEPLQSAAITYTKAELGRRLASIKAQQGRSLYTRVVIPAQSSISHNEAWQFTQEILRGYDYYYQEYPDSSGDSATP